MDFFEAVARRRTTNGPVDSRPVTEPDKRRLIDVAGMAPSHFNSQPWRFVLIDDPEQIGQIADVSRESMRQVFEEGRFFSRYRKYFRFSEAEMERTGTGILFDQLPKLLRPLIRFVFTDKATSIMNRLNIPAQLSDDNRDLVAGSPLLLAVLLDKDEYRPGELSGFYSVFGMGAAIENIWLATAAMNMGIQFISFPMEVPEQWRRIESLLEVPDDLELMALYRIGYLPEQTDRPTIDWSSRHRRRVSDYVFLNRCSVPAPDDLGLHELQVDSGVASNGASVDGVRGPVRS